MGAFRPVTYSKKELAGLSAAKRKKPAKGDRAPPRNAQGDPQNSPAKNENLVWSFEKGMTGPARRKQCAATWSSD